MTDSQRLLADYLNNGSEAAFQELVARYLDLVYSTAVRLVNGDAHLAEDVTQTVFVDLARLANRLSGEVRLGGWLHRHTCFVAANTLRSERRRQSRERQATEMNALTEHSEPHLAQITPILDEAINQLGAADRTAVLLRFYERLDFRSVGEALGTNEAAAQKRVSRALEKLHTLLKHRGVVLSATALAVVLADEAVTAAPVGLAASISGTALASSAAGTGTTLTLLKFMAATKMKSAIVTAIIVASVMTPLLFQRQAQARLREQDGILRQQTDQLAGMAADNQRLTALLARPNSSLSVSDNQLHELLKLRSEVGRLRANVQEMTSPKTSAPQSPEDQLASLKKMYAMKVDRLKQWLEANPSEKIPEFQNLRNDTWLNAAVNDNRETNNDLALAAGNLRDNAELEVLSKLSRALRSYVSDNNGQFPTDLSQLTAYLKTPIDDAILQRYEILPASSLDAELQPGDAWVITQRAPVNPALDTRFSFGLNQMRNAGPADTNRWILVQ